MDVGARDVPLGRQCQIDGEKFAVGVGCGLNELDRLAAYGIGEYLSCVCPWDPSSFEALRPGRLLLKSRRL